jgi:hypothetical protein
MSKPEVHAWFLDEPIAGDDPLAAVKHRGRALWAAGEVLEQAALTATVAARAELLDAAADLFGDPAFTLEEAYEAAEAAMPGDMVNAASWIALVLGEIERGRRRATLIVYGAATAIAGGQASPRVGNCQRVLTREGPGA